MRRILRITAILVLNTMLILLLGELIARAALWNSALTPKPEEAEFAFSAAGYGDLRPNTTTAD